MGSGRHSIASPRCSGFRHPPRLTEGAASDLGVSERSRIPRTPGQRPRRLRLAKRKLATVVDRLLREQIDYLRERSPFYAARVDGPVRSAADLRHIRFLTKNELREGQRANPPFGLHLCAPSERLVRVHVTSGTTGDPVAIGLTHCDHQANSAIGGQAFRIAGVRSDDTIAHCLNYALTQAGLPTT